MDDNNNLGQDLDILGALGIMANMLQVATYIDAQGIASNTDIMKALEIQNQVYLNEIVLLLKEISEKQDKILGKLNKGE